MAVRCRGKNWLTAADNWLPHNDETGLCIFISINVVLMNIIHMIANWWHAILKLKLAPCHYSDVILGAMAFPIISLPIPYSTIYSGADQRKRHSPASLAWVRGIHRWPVNSQYKWPVMRKMFPLDDVIKLFQIPVYPQGGIWCYYWILLLYWSTRAISTSCSKCSWVLLLII